MKLFLFTLFVRFFVAFSGLVVFVISSKLYGAEGRGLIGFGTSIVSLFGLLLSFNLGRSFLCFLLLKNKASRLLPFELFLDKDFAHLHKNNQIKKSPLIWAFFIIT